MEYEDVVIQTHDGKFHVEVAAISLLTNYFAKKNVNVKLYRNNECVNNNNILIDIGGIYDPSTNKFDRHQKDFNGTFNKKSKIPLSSVGMIWKHYGKEISKMYIQSKDDLSNLSLDKDLNGLHEEIYFKLIQELDAADNKIPIVQGGTRNYWSNLNLASIIKSINGNGSNEDEQLQNFEKAVSICGIMFDIKFYEVIKNYSNYIKDFNYVKDTYNSRKLNDEYLVFDRIIPTVWRCINDLDPEYNIKFIVLCESECITIKTRCKMGEMYKSIIPLLPEVELRQKLYQPNEIIFIHKDLFTAKTTSLDTAKEIIMKTLEAYKIKKDSQLELEKINNTSMSKTVKIMCYTVSVGIIGGIILNFFPAIIKNYENSENPI